MKKLFDWKLQNRTAFGGAKRIWTCWKNETPRIDSALLTKPFHRPLLLCNLNSYSEVLRRKLVLEQFQAEKAPPCLWTASVSSTAPYRGWRALQNAVWKTLPSMRPEKRIHWAGLVDRGSWKICIVSSSGAFVNNQITVTVNNIDLPPPPSLRLWVCYKRRAISYESYFSQDFTIYNVGLQVCAIRDIFTLYYTKKEKEIRDDSSQFPQLSS